MSEAASGDWRAALFARRSVGVRLGTASMEAVLDQQLPGLRQHPPFAVVQIVGTNGKGSTAAMLDHGLRSLGPRAPGQGGVGLFTSPHLERIGERIRVDGQAVSDEAVRAGVAAVAAAEAAVGVSLSFFEVLTAVALWTFVEAGCRVVVLEAGLGGRLDATTAMPARVVGVARIGLDHQAYLGEDLASIAAEKAAVIRPGVPTFSVEQAPTARRVIEARAAAQGAPLRFVAPLAASPPGLPGAHQTHNAALALALLRSLDSRASFEAIAGARWPGRLERLADPRWPGELWLDVAHNLEGVEALVAAIDAGILAPELIVFGAMADKPAPEMAARLRSRAPLWLVPPAREGAFDLAQLARKEEPRYAGTDDPRLLADLQQSLDDGAKVLVCGSHYLVGALRARLGPRHGRGRVDGPELSDPLVRAATQTRS